jgi:hypothetical protein
MQQAEQRLRDWTEEFSHLSSPPKGTVGRSQIDVFLALTLRNVMGSLTDLEQLGRALNNQPVSDNPKLRCRPDSVNQPYVPPSGESSFGTMK